uniref:WRKY transcription factor WRKY24 isoform X2 n=1 Tax=Erigeron canadensis TaxID=72917 RepID=UPI001CB8B2F2|nr:WRKY transcription factor WRKY24 isoform X2 [Erigeron canadensis]
MMDKASENLELTNKDQTSLSDQETKSESTVVKESHESGSHASHSNQEGSSITVSPDKELEKQDSTLPTGSAASECLQEGNAIAKIPKNESNTSQQTAESEQDQDNIVVAVRPEKGLDKLPLRRNADNITPPLAPPDQGVAFSKLPEKPTGDGYNWRKYGQKFVKGNTFVRSYYKCTFTNCPARKQVERSHDGNITEINYLWKHDHPKPQMLQKASTTYVLSVQSKASDELSLTTSEETETPKLSIVPPTENPVEVAVSQSNDMKNEASIDLSSDSKRQKRENPSTIEGISTKTNCEPRVVVQTTSAVDIVNDGYRWRKYGQKLVKGNLNPRSYYRCSSAGCFAKKHVERASHDEKVVITTYEGRHDHDMPAGGRTVSQNMSGTSTGITSVNNDGSRSQPESGSMEMVLHVSAT